MLKGLELNGFSQFEFDIKTSLKICAYKLFVCLGGGGVSPILTLTIKGGGVWRGQNHANVING